MLKIEWRKERSWIRSTYNDKFLIALEVCLTSWLNFLLTMHTHSEQQAHQWNGVRRSPKKWKKTARADEERNSIYVCV